MISHERYLEALRIKSEYEKQATDHLAFNGILTPQTAIMHAGISLRLRNGLMNVFTEVKDIDRMPLSELSKVPLSRFYLTRGIGPLTVSELVAICAKAGIELLPD